VTDPRFTLRVLSTLGLRGVITEITPIRMRRGLDFSASYGATNVLMPRITAGETADVAILTDVAIEGLGLRGTLLDGSRRDLARSAIGIAVKAGAPRPDISTVEAFKQAMLNAKSIGYVDNTPTGAALKAIFAKLGIADQVNAKLKPLTIQAADAVAKGDVEIAMTQVSEILPVAGAELVGPLPADIQVNTVFAIGVSTAAKNADGAAALIKFLTAPPAAAVIKSKGMEPG
jgi:molybdate transport system substrate-binding protein